MALSGMVGYLQCNLDYKYGSSGSFLEMQDLSLTSAPLSPNLQFNKIPRYLKMLMLGVPFPPNLIRILGLGSGN